MRKTGGTTLIRMEGGPPGTGRSNAWCTRLRSICQHGCNEHAVARSTALLLGTSLAANQAPRNAPLGRLESSSTWLASGVRRAKREARTSRGRSNKGVAEGCPKKATSFSSLRNEVTSRTEMFIYIRSITVARLKIKTSLN